MEANTKLIKKSISARERQEFLEGMEGDGTLENVRKFLESKGIELKPQKKIIEKQPSQVKKKKKKKKTGRGAPNPLNPNEYKYSRISIVRG